MKAVYYSRPEFADKIEKMGISSIIFESKAGEGASLITKIN